MRKQTRYRLQIVCGLAILLLAAIVLLLGFQKLHWSGVTALTVEFIVTDSETGAPIEGAEIFVYDDLHGSNTHDASKPRLITGPEGVASETIPTRCGGASSRFGLNDTRSVDIPVWMVWVKAPGFTQTDPFSLTERESIQHLGPSQDKLVVPIALHKSRP
jgi:hypothetical protein